MPENGRWRTGWPSTRTFFDLEDGEPVIFLRGVKSPSSPRRSGSVATPDGFTEAELLTSTSWNPGCLAHSRSAESRSPVKPYASFHLERQRKLGAVPREGQRASIAIRPDPDREALHCL